MFRGFAPIDGPDVRYPFPPGVTPGPYPLSGDPVTGKGFIDGLGLSYAMSPGDRRLILMSGPFNLAPGDTQEVVVATVVGLGADRFSSVAVLKFNDQYAQNTFDALFVVPVAPSPKVITAELDGSLVLDWGWDPETIVKTEGKTIEPGSFAFEGYNVYQLPTQAGTLNSGRRIATFDVVNSYSVLLDETFDEASGLIIQKPVQFGSNSGVKKVYEFKADALGDHPTLYNGQEYYLAVTAYFRSTKADFLPQVLESAPARIRGIPQKPAPGTTYNAKIDETIAVTHPVGNAEGSVVVKVIDPSRLTGDTYRVTFTGTGASKTYNIVNVTKNKTMFFSGRNYGEDWGGMAEDYPTADGMLVKVTEGAGVSNATTVWTGGTQWIDGTNYWGDPYSGFKESVLPGAKAADHLGQYAPSFPLTSIYPIEIRFDAANPQKAYRIVRHATYTQNVYMIGKSFGSTSKDTLPVINVPFSVWDVSKTPARQLTVSVRDNNRNGVWDCASGEFFNIYDKAYDPTMTQFGTTMTQYQTPNIATGGPTADIVYIADLKIAAGQTMSASVGTLKISPKLAFTTTDQFTFSPGSMKAEYGNIELAKEEVNKVNVFPNPYYALNAAETNRFARFVTFSHLPANCTIRIFNLAGHLVRSLVKDGASNPTQFMQWDLNNQYAFPVASGVYIAHIDMPDLGTTKVLKVAIIQEQEVLIYY